MNKIITVVSQLIIIISIISDVGCIKKNSSDTSFQNVIPLTVGNRWIYSVNIYDTVGSITYNYEETKTVRDNSVEFGIKMYEFSWDEGMDLCFNSDQGFVRYAGCSFSTDHPDTIPEYQLIFKYPAKKGDSYNNEYKNKFEVASIDTPIIVPAGQFHCIKYLELFYYHPQFIYAAFYVDPGYGIIRIDKYSLENNNYRLEKIYELKVFKKPIVFDSTCVSLDSLRNALIHDDDLGWVRLNNGEYKDDASGGYIHFVGDFTLIDIDNDGLMDVIGELSENGGGSGCFISAVVFLNRKRIPIYTDSYYIGDREGIDSIVSADHKLNIYFKVHGPNDAMCCPTQSIAKVFKFENNKLVEVK